MESSSLGRIHLFDCDGVLLDSNNLKIQAMQDALAAVAASKEFIAIATENFRQNFGISRLDHFTAFQSISTKSFILTETLSAKALSFYANNVISLYRESSKITATESYISELPLHEKIFVVSASDQSELRYILPKHFPNIPALNIFGGPTSKMDNIKNILDNEGYKEAILYGDSIHDARAAKFSGIDFFGLSEYAADAEGLSLFCDTHNMPVVKNCMQIPV